MLPDLVKHTPSSVRKDIIIYNNGDGTFIIVNFCFLWRKTKQNNENGEGWKLG